MGCIKPHVEKTSQLYIAFIESGEIYETTPEIVRKEKFVIQVYALYKCNEYGKEFYDLVRNQLHGAGYGSQFNYRPMEEQIHLKI